LAKRISDLPRDRPQLVAIDGASGVGKSTFGDELAAVLAGGSRPVVRASIDSFHNPRAVRYRRGKASPEGYYLDSHDFGALEHELLAPFRNGSAFRRAVFDEPTDSAVDAPAETAPPSAVLVFDGLFLLRPQLRHHWDLAILLTNNPRPEPAHDRGRRYVDGYALYVADADPVQAADIVVDNDCLEAPVIRRSRPA
jgi:uridine kinase